jgi:iron complex transport system ATP-binding protein
VLLLDEQTTYLDVAHQLDVLELIQRMNLVDYATIVMVLHDLSMAARYADRTIALSDGEFVADGAPSEVITPSVLATVFDLKAAVIVDPISQRPHVLPVRRLGVRS